MTSAREEALKRVSCIYYLIQIKNINVTQVQALINLGSEVNVIHLSFAKQLGFFNRPTDVGIQKVDNIMLDTYRILVAAFSVMDKSNQVRFFEKTFLVANVSPEIVFWMLFLILSNKDIDFSGRVLRWKTYTTEETLPTTKRVKLVGKKEFTAAALDPEHETYIVHGVSLRSTPLNVHPSRKAQISSLIAENALTKVPNKYTNFADVFSLDLASELFKNTGINNYVIQLVNGQEPSCRLLHSLGPVELETLNWDQSS